MCYHPPSPLCRCAAPPSLWQKSLCWSSSRQDRSPLFWSEESSSAAPWGLSRTVEKVSPGLRLPLQNRLRLGPPRWASLQRLASRTRPRPHVDALYPLDGIHKQDSAPQSFILPCRRTQTAGRRCVFPRLRCLWRSLFTLSGWLLSVSLLVSGWLTAVLSGQLQGWSGHTTPWSSSPPHTLMLTVTQ